MTGLRVGGRPFLRPRTLVAALALALVACQAEGPGTSAVESGKFAAIGPGEIIHFTGTEPFWGGNVSGRTLTYTTPENPRGTAITVARFAGNSGLGYSGKLDGQSFDLAITQGQCSDGMSERIYPFTATLRLGEEQRNGCAWTDRAPFEGPRRQ